MGALAVGKEMQENKEQRARAHITEANKKSKNVIASMPSKVRRPDHSHPLSKSINRDTGRRCDICGSLMWESVHHLRCDMCDFDVCHECC